MAYSIDINVLDICTIKFLRKNPHNFNVVIEINIKKLINYFNKKEFLSDRFYIVPELDEAGREHYHVILAVKTLVYYNMHVKLNLLNVLRKKINLDTNLNILNKFEKISKKLNYFLKQSYPEYKKYAYINKCSKFI